MKLEELLEYLAEEYLDDRTVIVDGDPDELWSDKFLVRQLNEGQRLLANGSWCIIEYGVAPAGVITLVTGKVLYPLHKSILKVYDATPTTQTAPLGRADDIRLRSPYPANSDAFTIGEAAALAGSTLTQPGPPIAIASDAASKTVRISPAPAAAQNGVQLLMKVARLPIKELSLDKLQECPEVPEQWHMAICEYAAGKALTLPNVDADQKVEGRRLLDKFDATIAEARRVRQRMEINDSRWSFDTQTALLDS